MSEEIDANLRRVYEEALNEQLPERFLTLLDKLKSGDATDTSGPGKQGDA